MTTDRGIDISSYPRARTVVGLAVLLIVAGCGFLRPDQPVYVGSAEVDPIDVPEDLSRPEIRPVYEIPGYSLPELAAQGDESLPPQVMTSAEAEQARSRVRFGPTGLYLEVDDEAASVWRRLGFALNRGEMAVEQVLTDQRRYRIRFEHEPIQPAERGWFGKIFLFWKSQEVTDYSGTYVLEVQPESSQATRVAILDEQGDIIRMERAEFILSRLQRRLG